MMYLGDCPEGDITVGHALRVGVQSRRACDDNGIASFDLVRHHRANQSIFLYAFDFIELNGEYLRRDPLEVRKSTLASIVAKAYPGIRFNEHIEADGPTVFAHAWSLCVPKT
jgi:ATP-dependent DNA ligase